MSSRLLKVRDWANNFENNRTRELKVMAWVPVPVKLDGDGYTELLDHPDGIAHFGAWIALLEVAARCEIRGTFLRQSRTDLRRPHDIPALARLTRVPVALLEEAVDRLVSIGWLEWEPFVPNSLAEACGNPAPSCDNPAPSCGIPAPSSARAEQNRIEEKGIEEEKRGRSAEGAPPAPTSGAPPPDSPTRKPENGKPPRFDPRTVPIPVVLDVADFREAWARRLKERGEPGATGGKPSESQITSQLRKLEKLANARGVAAAVACVERATEGRYQGVVFPEDLGAARPGQRGGFSTDGEQPLPFGANEELRRRAREVAQSGWEVEDDEPTTGGAECPPF